MTLQELRNTYDPEDLTRALSRMFSSRPPAGFVVGRTMIRNAVVQMLACSQLEAEEVVDTLILRRKLVFMRPSAQIGSWAFRVAAPN